MKKISIAFTILLYAGFCIAQDLQIMDDWYYIDGQKFFIKGIGYETHTRPGQVPWVYAFDADLITFDLNRIKNAGYNTIRTWGALTEEELQLVESSGLKILYGIWIDPHEDYADPNFIGAALDHVNAVLEYSQNYSCIIGYIIMNEPQVQHIYDIGAGALSELWQLIITLIHERHPGIPVSFSNTMIGDYINMGIFDFAAYNAYIYNPVTISGSHGYAGFLSFLKSNRSANMPMIVSEFGLSVSPGVPNPDYGYGGNTPEQQVSGNLLMYRELIDAGAQGSCVFQYHDGWWKGGNENVHDPVAEEWFGLIEFSGLSDIYGTRRPVWQAFEQYNRAIIASPKNQAIYSVTIPLEFFMTEDVALFTVIINDTVVISQPVIQTWYNDTLTISPPGGLNDLELVFEFKDADGTLLKSESISILYAGYNLQLPQIDLALSPTEIIPGGRNDININVTTNPEFEIVQNTITYVAHTHIGFDPGVTKSQIMAFSNNSWSYTGYFDMPSDTRVATFGAGFTITYGDFRKNIHNQILVMSGDWADPIAAPELVSGIGNRDSRYLTSPRVFRLHQNYPNPFNPLTMINYQLPMTSDVELSVYNLLGQKVKTLVSEKKAAGYHEVKFNAQNLSSGIYYYKIKAGEFQDVKKMVLLK
jgi:hypothetical protein